MWLAVSISALGALVTAGGILAVRNWRDWAEAHKGLFIAFAAGVLIAVSFLHLIPEAFERTPRAAIGLLLGFALLHLLNWQLVTKVCTSDERAARAMGVVPLVGIGFHSFLDGIVFAVGFSVNPATGLLMAAGMVLHEFPEGIVTYSLLLLGGFAPRRALLLALLAASLSTPLGTLFSYPLVERLDPPLLGFLLAMSAGALVYVGATHLLPEVARERGRFGIVALAGGVLVAIAISAVA